MGFLKNEKNRKINIKRIIQKAKRIQRLYDEDAPRKQKIKQWDIIIEEIEKGGITFDEFMAMTFVERHSTRDSEIQRKLLIMWDKKPTMQKSDRNYTQQYWDHYSDKGFIKKKDMKTFHNIFFKYHRPRNSEEQDIWY